MFAVSFFPMPNVSVHLIPRLSMGNVKKFFLLFLFSIFIFIVEGVCLDL